MADDRWSDAQLDAARAVGDPRAAKAVKVLHMTARLETDAQRRVIETAQLLVDVMASGGLSPSGAGKRSAQKVRLLHAAVRYLIGKSGQWDPALGVPINQEDLAF